MLRDAPAPSSSQTCDVSAVGWCTQHGRQMPTLAFTRPPSSAPSWSSLPACSSTLLSNVICLCCSCASVWLLLRRYITAATYHMVYTFIHMVYTWRRLTRALPPSTGCSSPQVKSSQVKSSLPQPDARHPKSSQVKSSQIKSSQVKSSHPIQPQAEQPWRCPDGHGACQPLDLAGRVFGMA